MRCQTVSMDPLTFWASVIKSVAWPIGALVIVTIVVANFRTQLRALLARMKTVKVAGSEATFAAELEDVRGAAEELVEVQSEALSAAEGDVSQSKPSEEPKQAGGAGPVDISSRWRENLSRHVHMPDTSILAAPREIEAAWEKLDEDLQEAFDAVTKPSVGVRLTTVAYRLHHLMNLDIVTAEEASTIQRLQKLYREVRRKSVFPTRNEAADFTWTAAAMSTLLLFGRERYLMAHPELSTEQAPE